MAGPGRAVRPPWRGDPPFLLVHVLPEVRLRADEGPGRPEPPGHEIAGRREQDPWPARLRGRPSGRVDLARPARGLRAPGPIPGDEAPRRQARVVDRVLLRGQAVAR